MHRQMDLYRAVFHNWCFDLVVVSFFDFFEKDFKIYSQTHTHTRICMVKQWGSYFEGHKVQFNNNNSLFAAHKRK